MSNANWGAMPTLQPAGGRLLVATPLLGDPHFSRSVVYLLEHDGGGSVGVIVNRPSHTPVGQVLPDWHDVVCGPAVVFGGGPVQPDGALCLGRLDGPAGPSPESLLGDEPGLSLGDEASGTDSPGGESVPPGGAFVSGTTMGEADVRPVVDGVGTVDLDGNRDAVVAATSRLRVFAGHAGWAGGQLEAEIAEGAWWVVEGNSEDVFSGDPSPLWSRVLRRQPPPLNLLSTYPSDPLLN